MEHLEQLRLISERDRQALEGPPPRQTQKSSEWEEAQQHLEEDTRGKKNTEFKFQTANTTPRIPTLTPNEQGTGLVLTGTKQKVKSDKYAKCNANLIQKECWPHISVLKKYTQRVPFNQLEFNAFVARKTHTIYMMIDTQVALGRLRLLSRIAHWQCHSKNWGQIHSLYEAIVELFELGKEDWTLDFSHYEAMVPIYTPNAEGKESKEKDKDKKEKEKKTSEVYWCKEFQRGTCTEKVPQMSSIKLDEPQVPVLHIGASCWQKDRKRKDHAESDNTCPYKKL